MFDELEAFLRCGDPALGFAWLECRRCDRHRLVPFSWPRLLPDVLREADERDGGAVDGRTVPELAIALRKIFAFNLLFDCTADHLPVEAAFALASVVSVGLVASYLRIVVGPRFAMVEAGLAQLLYQVGFGTAHFFDGYTGLTITVLGVVTLFALMQITGRIAWGKTLGPGAGPA